MFLVLEWRLSYWKKRAAESDHAITILSIDEWWYVGWVEFCLLRIFLLLEIIKDYVGHAHFWQKTFC